MENAKQLANRLREVILSGKWIAHTNFKDQLSQLSWQQAAHKIGSLNTIAALTFHVNYYLAGVLNVFEGGTLDIRDKYSFELKDLDSEEDWQRLLKELWANGEKFATLIEMMSDEKLNQGFVDEKYGSYRRNIEGIIEHSYYHLGQVSLLRKMIMEMDK